MDEGWKVLFVTTLGLMCTLDLAQRCKLFCRQFRNCLILVLISLVKNCACANFDVFFMSAPPHHYPTPPGYWIYAEIARESKVKRSQLTKCL